MSPMWLAAYSQMDGESEAHDEDVYSRYWLQDWNECRISLRI